MGQHANQRAWLEFERRQNKAQDEFFDAEPPLSDEELAAISDDNYWRRLDAEARGRGERA